MYLLSRVFLHSLDSVMTVRSPLDNHAHTPRSLTLCLGDYRCPRAVLLRMALEGAHIEPLASRRHCRMRHHTAVYVRAAPPSLR